MACARLAKPTGVFCFRSHPVKVARVGSSMAIPIAECRPCICFSPGMCCPDDRAHWRAHCQFFYPFSMGTCTKLTTEPRGEQVVALVLARLRSPRVLLSLSHRRPDDPSSSPRIADPIEVTADG